MRELRNCYPVSAHALKVIDPEFHGIVDSLAILCDLVPRRDQVGLFALRQTNGLSAVAFQQCFLPESLRVGLVACLEKLAPFPESA